MIRSLKYGARALALAIALSLSSAHAVTTTTTAVPLSASTYVDLGPGPMLLGAAGGKVIYQIADAQPAIGSAGDSQQPGPPILLNVTAHVWALGAGSTAIVSAGTGLAASPSVSGYDIGVPFSPTLALSAYAANTAVGAMQTVSWFRSTFQPSGIFSHITLDSKQGFIGTLTAYIFDTAPTGTTCNDNATFVLGSVDLPKLAMAPIALTPSKPQGATQTIIDIALARSIKNQDTPSLTQNVYICLVNGPTVYTPSTASDLFIKLSGTQD